MISSSEIAYKLQGLRLKTLQRIISFSESLTEDFEKLMEAAVFYRKAPTKNEKNHERVELGGIHLW